MLVCLTVRGGATRVQRISARNGQDFLVPTPKGAQRDEQARGHQVTLHAPHTHTPLLPAPPHTLPPLPHLLTRPLLAPLGFLLLLVLHFVVVLLTRFQSTCIQARNLRTGWTEAETGCANGRGGPGTCY